MAPAALMVSWAGLTTFASGLYHAMSTVGEGEGGVKERKKNVSVKGQKQRQSFR